MIRRVTTRTDLDALVESGCGELFAAEAGIGSFSRETFLAYWDKILTSDHGAIWIAEIDGKVIGGIGGLCYPDMNTGLMGSVETFWYILPDHRGSIRANQLLVALENWAASKGSVRHSMIKFETTMDERYDRFYVRAGYMKAETVYIKNLQLWQSHQRP